MEKKSNYSVARVSIGVLLVALGVALIAANFGLLGDFSVWRYWPAVFVAIGMYRLANSESHKERKSAAWFLFIGIWLLVSLLHWFDLSFRETWPAFIIAAGISSVWDAIHDSRKHTVSAEVTS